MSGAIPDMSVKMNSDHRRRDHVLDELLGGGNLYGSVPNTGATTCAANTATWTFTQTTTTNFSFYGEADGNAPGRRWNVLASIDDRERDRGDHDVHRAGQLQWR